MNSSVNVIGAGLAGCEAAKKIADCGIKVKLFEMKPTKLTPAHSYSGFSELVCSNSLKGLATDTASGLLKEELSRLGSLTLEAAEITKVPAGGALAVDRKAFSDYITDKINSHKNIEVIEKEVDTLDYDGITVLATGPLSTGGIFDALCNITGQESLYFFDAAAPIISGDSIDYSKTFIQARYDKGGADYINCPLTKEEYAAFVSELVAATRAKVSKEDIKVYESCMPIEIMAGRSADALRFGPLKPVGLRDLDGMRPYAVVQLRKENTLNTLFNIVGFQTNLTFAEQSRVFRMIPALKNADIVKYGVMHRNTYINSPKVIDRFFRVKTRQNLFIAGQLSGVEGYVESAASGILCGINVVRTIKNQKLFELGDDMMLGSIIRYITTPNINFQPMNANFGIIPPLDIKIKDKIERKKEMSRRSLTGLDALIQECKDYI